MTISLIGFGLVLLLALAGLPIALSMLAVGFAGFAYVIDWSPALAMTGQIAWETTLNYGLSVLPLFILMGNFLNQGRLSTELYEASNAFVGHHRGGLAMATVIACGGFSAVCGSSLATAATMAKVSMPPMRQFRYADGLAAGAIAAGGTLGILIPPSTVFVIYGILTQSDIGKLFAAGVLPGILAVALFCAAIAIVVRVNPAAGPPGIRASWRERLRALGRIWGIVAIFALVIGGIYVGAFTPTEAAGIGAFGAFVFVVSRTGFSWRSLRAVAIETARTTSVMFLVLIGALVFSNFINVAGMSLALGDFVRGLQVGQVGIILTIIAIYLVLGCVFESMSMILLTVPVFFPIVQQQGIDPIWFGVIVVVATEISLITPPVGLNVFVIKGIYRDIETTAIFRGVMPFVIADFILVGLIIAVPGIATLLPSFMK
jgi:C4-dicarboxylate transporter, DctM subunit